MRGDFQTLTLAMFPVLLTMYVRLAHREEREVAATFGSTWDAYAAVTPRWVPRFGGGPAPSGDRAEGRR